MLNSDLLDIYCILRDFKKNHDTRTKYSQFRAKYLNPTFVKQAFDTRRINQNTEFNPRRNLQYYQRSEPFIDEKTAAKVKLFFKIKIATDDIRNEFIGEPDWLDSYTRILCNALDQTLRVDQKDFDYSANQLDYLAELLYVRYRLEPDDIINASTEKLRQIFMNKDEKLLRRSVFVNYKDDFSKQGNFGKNTAIQNDSLMDKLFGDVKATKENKNVKRTVSITIDDQIVDKEDKNVDNEGK